MEADLTAYLLQSSPLTDLVGSRITWKRRPQGSAFPAVVLHMISEPRTYTMEGPVDAVETRIQADCWADDPSGGYLAAADVADALKFRVYDASPFTLGGTHFLGMFVDATRDGNFELGAGGDELSRRIVDIMVWHRPA